MNLHIIMAMDDRGIKKFSYHPGNGPIEYKKILILSQQWIRGSKKIFISSWQLTSRIWRKKIPYHSNNGPGGYEKSPYCLGNRLTGCREKKSLYHLGNELMECLIFFISSQLWNSRIMRKKSPYYLDNEPSGCEETSISF